MKNGLKDIIGKQIAAIVVAESDRADSPAPSTLEKLLTRDLDAWREANAAIGKAKGGK